MILQPYAKTNGDQGGRVRNLEEIMKRGMRFGYTLFSHPSSWKFDWQGTNDKQLVVFPGLLQMTNEAGGSLQQPRSLGDKETMRL